MPFDPSDITLSLASPEMLIHFSGSDGPFPWIVSKVSERSRKFDETAWAFVEQGPDATGVPKGKLQFNLAMLSTLSVTATRPRTLSMLVMCGGIEQALTVKVTL